MNDGMQFRWADSFVNIYSCIQKMSNFERNNIYFSLFTFWPCLNGPPDLGTGPDPMAGLAALYKLLHNTAFDRYDKYDTGRYGKFPPFRSPRNLSPCTSSPHP